MRHRLGRDGLQVIGWHTWGTRPVPLMEHKLNKPGGTNEDRPEQWEAKLAMRRPHENHSAWFSICTIQRRVLFAT